MQALTLLIVALLAVSSVSAANNGEVAITVDGNKMYKYVLSSYSSKSQISVNGSAITLRGGGRVYLGNSETISINSYYQMNLLGKRLKFDVDLSQVGCNCNGALYLVQMPAYNSGQQPQPGEGGDYYCDANQVGGTYCPEMDVMESNKFAMASTAHTCDYHAPHYYSNCDRGGCGTNVLDAHGNEFGPGKTIDTNRPFTLSVAFITGNDGKLSTINNYFWQDGKTIQFNSCNSNYLQWMGYSLPGIVVTMSLWGTGDGGMSWLDGKSGCHGGCNLGNSKVSFSNIQIEKL